MGPTFKNKNKNKNNNLMVGLRQRRKQRREGRSLVLFLFLFSLAYLFDIWSFDRRNSSGKERKVLYSTGATREYQKQGILMRF